MVATFCPNGFEFSGIFAQNVLVEKDDCIQGYILQISLRDDVVA